ncbi:MAG: LTA synthase family protein [Sphingobacteriia bacterium]|nr:LTA synthase family protein [Sphingobacteriia bacterium]NCC38850.1 LTA synthase family protein [Gammaproteobacteria bacterium]
MGLLFNATPGPQAWRADLLAHLLLAALLFGMAHNLRRFILGTLALFTTLTLGNALKLSILGGPLMPDDFLAARNMLLLLDGWQLVGAVLMVVVPAFLLWWMIAWRRLWSWVNLGAIATGVGLLLLFPEPSLRALDQRFGDWIWNQRGNFEARGLPIHLLQEGVRTRARREPAPSANEVATALVRLGVPITTDLVRVGASTQPRRNLHMIVLESFWDPLPLTASKLSADPLDPRFRELWAAADHSQALAPVFGGYTANTELEILCGFPVERDNVFFEGGLRRSAPCLPRHLGAIGYHSFASHPNTASFWNRVNAYQRIGFQTYWSDGDFELDDMNREFLSDASLYRQVLERLGPRLQEPAPIFNYVLTYFGHLPYPLNAQRPPIITAAEGHDTVAAYANTLYYKSRELMDFLGELRQRDPDALVVLFGDHLPALGNQFGGYRESGLLAKDRAAFSDDMFRTLVATPLILIDGRRGVLSLGDLPLYQLPGLVLRLLGDTRPSMMAWTAPTGDSAALRPLPGLHFVSDGQGVRVCRDSASEDPPAHCTDSTAWLAAIRILMRDIFGGAQHALRHLTTPTGMRAAALGEDPGTPTQLTLGEERGPTRL